MGKKPNCDAWSENYVFDYCHNDGYIPELINSTTPAPGVQNAQNVCDCKSYVSCNDYGVSPCPTDSDVYFNPCIQG